MAGAAAGAAGLYAAEHYVAPMWHDTEDTPAPRGQPADLCAQAAQARFDAIVHENAAKARIDAERARTYEESARARAAVTRCSSSFPKAALHSHTVAPP